MRRMETVWILVPIAAVALLAACSGAGVGSQTADDLSSDTLSGVISATYSSPGITAGAPGYVSGTGLITISSDASCSSVLTLVQIDSSGGIHGGQLEVDIEGVGIAGLFGGLTSGSGSLKYYLNETSLTSIGDTVPPLMRSQEYEWLTSEVTAELPIVTTDGYGGDPADLTGGDRHSIQEMVFDGTRLQSVRQGNTSEPGGTPMLENGNYFIYEDLRFPSLATKKMCYSANAERIAIPSDYDFVADVNEYYNRDGETEYLYAANASGQLTDAYVSIYSSESGSIVEFRFEIGYDASGAPNSFTFYKSGGINVWVATFRADYVVISGHPVLKPEWFVDIFQGQMVLVPIIWIAMNSPS